VYWIDFGSPSGTGPGTGSVNAVPVGISNGPVTTIASNLSQPWDIVTDGAYVYWTENANPGYVKRAPITGGVTPTILASMQAAPYGIALDPATVGGVPVSPRYVYWTNYDGDTVVKLPCDGSGTQLTLATNQNTPAELYDDTDRNVYWAGGAIIYKLAQASTQ
jgi:hypothetical protein